MESSEGLKQSSSMHKVLPVHLDELEAADDEVQEQKWRYVFCSFFLLIYGTYSVIFC